MQGNKCILCGKETILLKAWEEEVKTSQGTSTLKYTKFVCPDPVCQAKVEAAFEEKRKTAKDRQDAADQRKEERNSSRTRAILKSRADHNTGTSAS